VGALAILLACAVAGTLLIQTGVASAASRGFFIYNHSTYSPLRFERVSHLPRSFCHEDICDRNHLLSGFEGRPHDGAVLQSDPKLLNPHHFELKYHFDLAGRCYYGALLRYKIVHRDATLYVAIETCTFSNNSACQIEPAHHGHCTAEPFAGGRKITYWG
jgi:hypothetical protein